MIGDEPFRKRSSERSGANAREILTRTKLDRAGTLALGDSNRERQLRLELLRLSVERSEGGARLSALYQGWDASLIYYDEADKTAVLFQRRAPQPLRLLPSLALIWHALDGRLTFHRHRHRALCEFSCVSLAVLAQPLRRRAGDKVARNSLCGDSEPIGGDGGGH